MRNFERPVVLVSKCIGFDACRYNGQMTKDDFVEKLKNYVNFIVVCPEVAIGMEVPREAIRLVKDNEEIRVVQANTGKDYTKDMMEFSEEFLTNTEDFDGCILKSRSPSCGIKDVRIYSSCEKGPCISKGKGIFADCVIKKFEGVAIEDDGRLKDFNIREHFLTKIFILSEFRKIKESEDIRKLKEFHNNNKLLFKMYNKIQLKQLDVLINKCNKLNLAEIFQQYNDKLKLIFAKNARYVSKINTLNKVAESFFDKLSQEEKEFILESIKKYEEGHIPYSVPLYLIKSYAIRFNDTNLLNQSLFSPYPEELVEMRDSGKVLI